MPPSPRRPGGHRPASDASRQDGTAAPQESIEADVQLISGAFAVFIMRVRSLGYDILPHAPPMEFTRLESSVARDMPLPVPRRDAMPVRFVYTEPRPGRSAKRPRPENAPEAPALSSADARKRTRASPVPPAVAAEVAEEIKRGGDVRTATDDEDPACGSGEETVPSLRRRRDSGETTTGGADGSRGSGSVGIGAGFDVESEGDGSVAAGGAAEGGGAQTGGGAESGPAAGVPFSTGKRPSGRPSRRRASSVSADAGVSQDDQKRVTTRRASQPSSGARARGAAGGSRSKAGGK